MRIVITGIDDQGRSCVVEEMEVPSLSGASDEFKVTVISKTDGNPVYPFQPQLDTYMKKWNEEYTLPAK